MKEYTEEEKAYISNDGEYRVIYRELMNESYIPTRLYLKELNEKTEIRIGNIKANYYTIVIPYCINYEQAYALLNKIIKLNGINKTEIKELSERIELNTKQGR